MLITNTLFTAAMLALGAALTGLAIHLAPWTRARIGAALGALALVVAVGCYFFGAMTTISLTVMLAGAGPIAFAVWHELRPWTLPRAGAAALFVFALLALGV